MPAPKKAINAKVTKDRGFYIPRINSGVILSLSVALALLLVLIYLLRDSPAMRGIKALVEATSKVRTIEPRLTGGFQAGKYVEGEDGLKEIDKGQLDEARRQILKAASEGKDLKTELALGMLHLIEKKPEDAMKVLGTIADRFPDDAEARNVFGVCLFENGKLEESLDQFDKAMSLDPQMIEAKFNRALCYQRLLIKNEAQEQFDEYVKIERDPAWLEEAKGRLEEVKCSLDPAEQKNEIREAFQEAFDENDFDTTKKIASKNIEVLANYASDEGAIEYLKEALAGNKERAEHVLSEVEYIGNLSSEFIRDESITDFARYLRNLPEEGRAEELKLIKEYSEAATLFGKGKYSETQPTFERLSKLFANRNNYFFLYHTTYSNASCLYSTGRLNSSVEELNGFLKEIEKFKWSYRYANMLLQLGSAAARLGKDSLAIKYYDDALKYLSGQTLLKAKSFQLMGVRSWYLGNLDAALKSLRQSTGLYLANVTALKDIAYNYINIADIYRLSNNHILALLCAKESLIYAKQAKNYTRAAQASSFAAVELAELGRFDEAEEHMKQAFSLLEEVNVTERVFTQSLVLTRAGDIALKNGDTTGAVDYYSKAKALTEKAEGDIISRIKILHGRAKAYAQTEDSDRAIRDLEDAVDLIEEYRARIAERENRSEFLDASHSVFDLLIELHSKDRARWEGAFEILEKSRARALLDELPAVQNGPSGGISGPANRGDLLRRDRVDPLTLSEVQAVLPDNLRILLYSVTAKGTYMFVVTNSSIEIVGSRATTQELDLIVREYLSDLKREVPIEELSLNARKLYEYLIKPVEPYIADDKILCIVPDKALHFLPFAALVDESNRYLFQTHTLISAPSASVLVQCIKESRSKPVRKEEKALIVGNPQFDLRRFKLSDLEDAEKEARAVANLYPGSEPLIGKQATSRQVRKAMENCDVAHLALHCLVQEQSPWLAALVLAPDDTGNPAQASDSEGLLRLNDVYNLNMLHTRLVVLSACQSGLGQYYRGEGMVSLVRPFLALRVPTVVASLWSVNSQATADLMVEFHRSRTQDGAGVGDALRAAQKKMIESGPYQHPYYWAPFIAVGSND